MEEFKEKAHGREGEVDSDRGIHDIETAPTGDHKLARKLQGRHMQMIAIGTRCLPPCSSSFLREVIDVDVLQVARSGPVSSSGPEVPCRLVVRRACCSDS